MKRDEILKMQFEDAGVNFRSTWELYLKFYTAFMTVNFAALGVTVQYIDQSNRWPLILSFVMQNLLSAVTAISIAHYSKKSGTIQAGLLARLRKDTERKQEDDDGSTESDSTAPSMLALWGGYANAMSHLLFITCWFAVLYV